MKAANIIGRGFYHPASHDHRWTEAERAGLQADLDALAGKHGLGKALIIIDNGSVQIKLWGALEPGEVAVLQRWLETASARLEAISSMTG